VPRHCTLWKFCVHTGWVTQPYNLSTGQSSSPSWCTVRLVCKSHRSRAKTGVHPSSERNRFTPPDLPSFADLCREADDDLFNSILNNSHYVLCHLLPPPSQVSQHYSLLSRQQNLQLSIGPTSLSDKNFLHCMLHSDSSDIIIDIKL